MERDPVYGEEEPDEMIRCILCGETMLKGEWPLHDCDIIPWEEADLSD